MNEICLHSEINFSGYSEIFGVYFGQCPDCGCWLSEEEVLQDRCDHRRTTTFGDCSLCGKKLNARRLAIEHQEEEELAEMGRYDEEEDYWGPEDGE